MTRSTPQLRPLGFISKPDVQFFVLGTRAGECWPFAQCADCKALKLGIDIGTREVVGEVAKGRQADAEYDVEGLSLGVAGLEEQSQCGIGHRSAGGDDLFGEVC